MRRREVTNKQPLLPDLTLCNGAYCVSVAMNTIYVGVSIFHIHPNSCDHWYNRKYSIHFGSIRVVRMGTRFLFSITNCSTQSFMPCLKSLSCARVPQWVWTPKREVLDTSVHSKHQIGEHYMTISLSVCCCSGVFGFSSPPVWFTLSSQSQSQLVRAACEFYSRFVPMNNTRCKGSLVLTPANGSAGHLDLAFEVSRDDGALRSQQVFRFCDVRVFSHCVFSWIREPFEGSWHYFMVFHTLANSFKK